jgi:hypothetical protein
MGGIPPSNTGENIIQRRSQRVMVKVSVVVLSQGADNRLISEETRTVTVNAHGAMILLTAKASVGQLLTLRNAKSGEEVLCRVAYVNPHLGEKKEVGIDFVKPCPWFWRISFPPADWANRAPEAKGTTNRYGGIPTDEKKAK